MRRRWYYFKRMLQADRLFVAQMIGNIIRMIQYAGRWIVLAVVCVAAVAAAVLLPKNSKKAVQASTQYMEAALERRDITNTSAFRNHFRS